MSYTYNNTRAITTEHRYTVANGSSIHDVEAARAQATSHARSLGIDLDDDNWAQIETSYENLTIVFTSFEFISSDEVVEETLEPDDTTSTHEVSHGRVHAYHVSYFDPGHDVDPAEVHLTINHSSDHFRGLTDHLTHLHRDEPAHVVRARVLGIIAAEMLDVEPDCIYDLHPA